jgi:C-terminal processing protease CtpA/Prc
MKSPLLTFLCIFIAFQCTQAQSATSDYHNRLYYLGKVWGYVKYFHPSVANCSVNLDEVLLDLIEEVKSAESDEVFNEILVEMIEGLGVIPEASTPRIDLAAEVSYNLDLGWFKADIFNDQLQAQLKRIEEEFRPRPHCLVAQAFVNGNPTFDADARYHSNTGDYPNESVRILSIFRYWNIINYFFPYKYVMDQDWDSTLRQFIPPVVEASDALSYHLAMNEMTTYINDTHAFFRSRVFGQWLGFNILPIFIKYIEGQTVVTKVHELARDKISVGDVILTIDGVAIDAVRDSVSRYIGASNSSALERDINYVLERGQQGAVELKVQSETGTKTVTLVRESFQTYESLYDDDGNHYEFRTGEGGCRLGYVDMGKLEPEEVDVMMASMRSMDAIIFDVRNYPNGTLWTLVNYLYERPINFSAFTNPDINHPGRLNFYQHSIGQGGSPYTGKLIILFNEETQSQAEFTVMGLELHPGAIKIGSQTAGADGNVSYIKLPGNIETIFTGLGVYYPDRTQTQRIGIVPDVELKPTIKGVRAGRDEVLEYAMNCDLIGFEAPLIVGEGEFDIFPNPTSDLLNIRSIREGDYTVRVLDVLGRTLRTVEIEDETTEYQIDLTNYPSGLYMLAFETKEEIFLSKQVVKE